MEKSLQELNNFIDSKGDVIEPKALGCNEPIQVASPFEFVKI